MLYTIFMLSLDFIRDNRTQVEKSIKLRGLKVDLDKLFEFDKAYRDSLTRINELRSQRNQLAKTKGKEGAAEGKQLKVKIKKEETQNKKIKEQLEEIAYQVPNIILTDVPIGKDEKDNQVVRKWGTPTQLDFKPKDHLELGERLDIIDTKTASLVTGPRFCYLKGKLAVLEFALAMYVLRQLTDPAVIQSVAESIKPGYSNKPFISIIPPVLIKPEVLRKMARLEPRVERYYMKRDDQYLIGSAEHTLGPLHMNQVLSEKSLPLRYLGFSTSFRREAGTYGKDTRGIFRLHQFDKLEMECFTVPENSQNEQNFLIAIQEYLLQELELPYQVVNICTGDIGAPDARQVDLETWLPGQNKYRETHTADLMTDYQARRLNTRVRRSHGKNEFVHMNDATAIAVGRTLIAIIENYQQKDSSIKIPKVLQSFCGFDTIDK